MRLLIIAYLIMDIQEINTLLADYSKVVTIGVYVFFGICALITLAKFWMGRQVLCSKGTSHIKLAKIVIIWGISVLVSDGLAIFNGIASYSEAISTITILIVMHSYFTTTKACL